MAKTRILRHTPTQQLKAESEMVILKLLRQDARMSMAKIAEKTGIPIPTVARKIDEIEDRCLVKYSSLINFDKLGYFVGSLFIIKPQSKDKSRTTLLDFISESSSINTASRTTDDHIIVEAYFRNMAELVDFRHFLGEFSDELTEHEIISDIVKERFMAKG